MDKRHIASFLGILLVSGLLFSACGGDDDNSLSVQLAEWSVTVDGEASAGDVSISAENVGAEPHEVVIVKGLSPVELEDYLDETGFVVEADLPDGAFVGEIEEFDAGEEDDGTFNLPAGEYTFFCNIVEEEGGGWESHFLEGMYTSVTISG